MVNARVITLSLASAMGFAVTLHAAEPAPADLATEFGFGIFQQRCMVCHGNAAVPAAPSPQTLREMAPERIYTALTSGAMQIHGEGLSDLERRRVAESIAGRLIGSADTGAASQMPNQCDANTPAANTTRPDWNGWSAAATNTRFQTAAAAGMSGADVNRLQLKWAFGFPGGESAFGQPAIVDGRVYVGTDTGWVYALELASGCVHWSYKPETNVRTAMLLGTIAQNGTDVQAVFFGDLEARVYALDAATGELIWQTRVDDHLTARVTAAPALHDGVLYVPVSSWEEFSAKTLEYPCCTFRGSVVALDAATGDQRWKSWVIPTAPQPVRKNSRGTQLYAPAGGAVWNTPTVDAARGAIYIGTGDAFTYPAAATSDSVIAIDMADGHQRWVYQAHADDSFLVGCAGDARTENCPKTQGPDWDIPMSPILARASDGRELVVVGTKPGDVFALDPDANGAEVWRVNASDKQNGMLWGGAVIGDSVYYGLSSGGAVKLKLKDGSRDWRVPLGNDPAIWHSAAATAIPGAVFLGGTDGMLYAVSPDTGAVLWSVATQREFDTVNGVAAKGGSLSAPGAAVADGYVVFGSGYHVARGIAGNVLLAFSIR